MRHFGSAKKTAKSTDDVLKSQIFQAIKAVSKSVKIVKTFLVLKCTKKITTLKDTEGEGITSSKLSKELEHLEVLKAIDQKVVAASIVRMKVPFGNDTRYNPTDRALDNTIDPSILKSIIMHKRIEDTLSELKSKVMTTIEKNNELRAKQQSKNTSQKQKSLFSKKDGYVDGTKAVFMDALDGSGDNNEKKEVSNKDLVKLNKSLRNQANRLANRAKNEKTNGESNENNENQTSAGQYGNKRSFKRKDREEDNDPTMMMYRPLDQRFPSSSSSSGGSSNTTSTKANPNKGRSNNTGRSTDTRRGSDRPSKGQSAVAAVPVADLTKAASFGKEWKTTGVHPSWAAKQHAKQQTIGSIPSVTGSNGSKGAVAGQGKKIVFDD